MLLVAWHGMIWSNGDRSWWPRLDAARIICFGFQDFQNFPWFWDLQIPVEIFEKFQDFKSCNKETCVIFFQGQSLAERWFVGRCFFLWIFPPQQNDGFAPTLAVSSEWLSLHGSVLSGISPGKSFTRGPTGSINVERWPNFFPLPDSTFTKHGLPFHLQRHLCSICINGAFVGSKSVCSLVGTSCGTNIKHRKNTKWRSDIREVMLLPTFRMVLGLGNWF